MHDSCTMHRWFTIFYWIHSSTSGDNVDESTNIVCCRDAYKKKNQQLCMNSCTTLKEDEINTLMICKNAILDECMTQSAVCCIEYQKLYFSDTWQYKTWLHDELTTTWQWGEVASQRHFHRQRSAHEQLQKPIVTMDNEYFHVHQWASWPIITLKWVI
jgi:hypothetical protein